MSTYDAFRAWARITDSSKPGFDSCTDHSGEAPNGKNQGPPSPKPGRNIVTTKMKNGNQLYDESRAVVLARLKQKRARGKLLPKRGDVKRGIGKELIDSVKAVCCAPGPFDVDAFVEDLPAPTRSEPTATVLAEVSFDSCTDHSGEAPNGKNQGPPSPKPGRNIVTTKMKNGNQLHDESRAVVLARLEQKRARGKPLPKRGDVKRGIGKELIDSVKAVCCVPGPFDVDAFVEDLPAPTRSEPTATFWPKVEI